MLWQGSVHRFEGPLPPALNAVQKWLDLIMTGNMMPTGKLCALFAYLSLCVLYFCRAMLCISAAYAVMRCLCMCLSRLRIMSKQINISSKFFLPSGSQTSLVFPYQMGWPYSDGNPLTGASNAGGVGRNRDSEPISGFSACC